MEREWIEKSLNGDEEAFAELVKLHQPKIFQQCLTVLHDHSLAEDVTQESFLRAFSHLKEFEQRSSFYTWLWRIAHNACVDALRKEKPHLELHEEQQAVAQKEDVNELVDLLPPKQRRIFKLYLEGMSQKEIAQRLNLPYGTVRSRLHYA
ncbi:MAG: sigma-70 family RNA polymerase sigma factor, partial [Chlamydiae bacterium]|nr:sigma-70 family RNA polymerase sigma factor [Chlamydiota bacterium]